MSRASLLPAGRPARRFRGPAAKPGCSFLAGALAVLLLGCGLAARGAVPASDITLQPVANDNLALFTSLTAYVYANDSDAVSTTIGGTNVAYDAPLYYPFDTDTPAWWDNLVAELSQARLPVVMFASRGTKTTNSTEIDGNMNPRQLTRMVDAMQRAGATNLFKLACFIDSPSLRGVYTTLHGLPSTNLLDMSSQSDWNDVFWLRAVKPWFDTVPRQYWFEVNGRPVVQWWSIRPAWFANQLTNAAKMLQFLGDAFQASYGVRPGFILDGAWASTDDPTSKDQPDVIGVNNWFGPPNTSFTYYTFNGFTAGTAVPGFINPTYFDPTSGNYQNTNLVIPHNKIDGSGVNGDTLLAGLEAGVAARSRLTVLEGWNDVREWAGYYRCATSPRYSFPSQYINIVRRYTDPRTETLRLEAEGADAYFDTTAGNSGGAWRRSGDLDIRARSGGGWAVTGTAAGEWIEFKDIQFSAGNYKFPVRYSALAARTLRLYVDGLALPDVTLPATGGTDLFDTAYLGVRAVAHGVHTLRLFFVDGGVDVDWLFVRKYDPVMTFQSALNGAYLAAAWGGNDALVCNWPAAGNWERFTVDDPAGGGALSSGAPVNLQAHDGYYLTATNGGGSALAATQRAPGSAETFALVKLAGFGPLTNGDAVALQTAAGNYVTVKADGRVDASGTSIGPAQTFTLQAAPASMPATPAAAAPTGLVATAVSGSQIALSWAPTPGATRYNLKRSASSGGPYTAIVPNLTGGTGWTDVRLPGSTTFYYVVSAVNAGGESADSAEAVATTATVPVLVSLGKTATASSSQSGNEPAKGNDANLGTRWAANGIIYPSWWRVDLGATYRLSGVNINWYGAGGRSYQYKLEVSTNGVNYTTAVDKTANTSTENSSDTFSAAARYVRVTVTGVSVSGGYPSFYECQVYGVGVVPAALNPTNLLAAVAGSTLTLSWPTDHFGWRLQVQTNPAGPGPHWITVPGSDFVTATNLPIDPANGAVFYRMVYP